MKDRRKRLLLAIDEGQDLNNEILRDLKILMNQDYDSADCFGLILVGWPSMGTTLEKPIHVALKQRVMVHYNFLGLTKEETMEYIYSRIEASGGSRSIISEAAVSAIAAHSNGVPR